MNLSNFFPDTLTDDQKQALDKIQEILLTDKPCFLLRGYAGTGKTFLMQGLVKYFRAQGRNFRLMAPTGRAAMVIRDKCGENAYTIHKSIYNLDHLEDDVHTFKFRYGINLNNEDSVNTVYIVDESSMISDIYNEDEFFVFGSGYLLRDLIDYIDFRYRTDAKIIFIGDHAQLPPVGMNFSPALDRTYLREKYQVITDEFELKQVVRQNIESGIIKTATLLRESLEKNEFNRFKVEKTDDISLLTQDNFNKTYFTTVNNSISENTIVITHSNKQAADYNKTIRDRFFPGQEEIYVNDILINTKNNYNYPVEIFNGQFLKVIEASEITEPPKTISFYKRGGEKAQVIFIFRDVILEAKDSKGSKTQLKCKIIDDFLKSDLPRLTSNEQQALYVDFKNRNRGLKPGTREFKETIRKDEYFNALQVKYGYAITCHKAQGGEWENAFVDFNVRMGLLTRSFFRWAYTAMTRSKVRLFAIDTRQYSPLTQFLVAPVTIINRAPANRDYIPESFLSRDVNIEFSRPFLKAKYIEIEEKLNDQDVEFSVDHFQWAERYTFKRDIDNAIIDLNYGSDGFTGKMRIINTSSIEFAQFIRQKISEPLVFELDYSPQKDFQKDLHDWIKEETSEADILITNIINEQYCDRYFLFTGANCAYLDCIYNGKGIYTSLRPYSTLGHNDVKLQLLIKRIS